MLELEGSRGQAGRYPIGRADITEAALYPARLRRPDLALPTAILS